jgi:flagellar hook assembly protein FlgD
VRRLFGGEQKPGYYTMTWDGRDESGLSVGSGAYICSIHAGTYMEKMKMTIIR